jgi:DNA repair protein RecN (Recombination protein N)
MLLSLSIRDIVLIDKLDLDWHGNLCTLTGETGAGKSILLDALGLALGARGDAGLVRNGAAQGSVTAVFDISENKPVLAVLEENGLQADARELILRRVQTADGRSRAFCNDAPVSVGLLAQLGSVLVEIHGQNESQALTDARTQRRLLDQFAGIDDDVGALGDLHSTKIQLEKRLAAHRDALARAAEEADYLTTAVAELQALEPQTGEEETLADQRTLLMNAEKIAADLDEAQNFLGGETGVETALNGALRRLEKAAPDAAGKLDGAVTALDRALIEAAEAREAVLVAASEIRHDPAELARVEDRLFALRAAARKHNVGCNDLPDVLTQLEQQLNDIDGGADRLAEMEIAYEAAKTAYRDAALKVSAARTKAAGELDQCVNGELAPLKLDGGRFETRVDTGDAEEGGADGIDRISFEASTNPGMAPGPIARIASGGELARFMLALKVSLAGSSHIGTLIFDEVDAGVGGAVAEAVGVRLHKLAELGQVLVVTHSPQVAARGDFHWKVSKTSELEATVTRVNPLDADARLEEVARMLSGANVTSEARAAAGKLLEADA